MTWSRTSDVTSAEHAGQQSPHDGKATIEVVEQLQHSTSETVRRPCQQSLDIVGRSQLLWVGRAESGDHAFDFRRVRTFIAMQPAGMPLDVVHPVRAPQAVEHLLCPGRRTGPPGPRGTGVLGTLVGHLARQQE